MSVEGSKWKRFLLPALSFLAVLLFSCHSNPEKKIIAPQIKTDSAILKSSPQKDTIPDTLKTIYLTFDDGPLPGTDAIIRAFDREKLPATMFMVGKHVQMSKSLREKYEMAYRDPFLETGNHSYSHANRKYHTYYRHPEKVLEDFDRNQAFLHLRDKDARMPGRSSWRVGNRKRDEPSVNGASAADLLHENGYTIFGWDLEWFHKSQSGKPQQKVEEIFEQIQKRISNPKKCFTPYHFVLLAHDEMFQKPWEQNELKQLIDLLKENGYKFDHINNYPRK
ncbi:MAG: hypothetical protein C5B52_15225 [Bacteroidetes bacterium]|nr:MAG: hypothetical protein C5B52_15225 [Bacteroidota bacterium]